MLTNPVVQCVEAIALRIQSRRLGAIFCFSTCLIFGMLFVTDRVSGSTNNLETGSGSVVTGMGKNSEAELKRAGVQAANPSVDLPDEEEDVEGGESEIVVPPAPDDFSPSSAENHSVSGAEMRPDIGLTSEQLETELRMKLIGGFGVTLVSLLFVALAYFRLNHATRGIYSRRLLTFALVVSIAILAGCAFFVIPLIR